MRILFVGNDGYKYRGERAHCFATRMRNGFVRNGHHLYFMSDRDIVHSKGVLRRLTGRKSVRTLFLEICQNFQPDMILLGQADFIHEADLADAREILPKVKIAAYCLDILFLKHIENTILSKIYQLDAVFCTTGGKAIQRRFQREGTTVAYIPNPADTSIDWVRAEQKTDQEFDVFWAMRGTKNTYEGDPRFDMPRALAKESDIKIDYYGFDDKPILLGADYYKAIANCKGGLNISVDRLNHDPDTPKDDLYLYSSDRIGHYFGCGLLMYIYRGFSLEEILPEDKMAVYFSSEEELIDKVKYYSKHDDERVKIASTGAEFYRKNFSETEVARYIEEVTLHGKTLSHFGWNTEIYMG